MELLLTLIVTPLLIAGGSLGARLWGPSVGGWLLAFPVTSGPLIFFLALTSGLAVGEHAAEGALCGIVSIAGFCVAYSRMAASGRWWLPCLGAGALGFLGVSAPMLGLVALPAGILFTLVVAVLWVAWHAMPRHDGSVAQLPRVPMGLPLRMVSGALVVLAVAVLMPVLGSDAGGILSMIPVTTSVVSIFAQRTDGRNAVFGIQRGLLVGLVATAAFSTVVSVSILPLGLLQAFALGIAAVVGIQMISLAWMRRAAQGSGGVGPCGRCLAPSALPAARIPFAPRLMRYARLRMDVRPARERGSTPHTCPAEPIFVPSSQPPQPRSVRFP